MRNMKLLGILIGLLILILPCVSQSDEAQPVVNLMISADLPLSSSSDEKNTTLNQIFAIFQEINSRKSTGTIFSTQTIIDSISKLQLTQIYRTTNFELGMSGNHSDEKLSEESLETQKATLEKSKRYVEACKICGLNEVTVSGFMPQSFDQNEDTYRVLDDMGIKYDAGFQAGIIYTPGHEKDVWPYKVEGHNFYAVPVSTFDLEGNKVILQDSYFKDNGLSASQWYDALAGKLDEIQGNDEPMVVSLDTSVSGSGEYLEALGKFIDYAISKKASFVTTKQLVDMAETGIRDVTSLQAEINESSCPTCGKSSEGGMISVEEGNNTTLETANETATA